MGNPLRTTDPSKIHLVTIRTEQALLWMVPSQELNDTILGIVARYQEIFGITLYAYVFLSNHPHLLVQAPGGNLDEFLENVNREVARRVNYHCKRRGKFWSRRYSDQVVLPNEADLEKAFLYVLTNPTKHGLVKHCRDWPGVTSYKHCLDEKDRVYEFTHYSKRDKKGSFLKTQHVLKITPLPHLATLSQGERSRAIKALVDQRCAEIAKDRHQNGQGFLGVKKILSQKPGSVAVTVSRSPRPPCYSGSGWRIAEFRAAEAARRFSYRIASLRFRLGDYSTPFPQFCHKPTLHRLPRKAPFNVIRSLPVVVSTI